MASFAGSGLSLGTLWVAITAKIDDALKDLKKFADENAKLIDETKKKWESLTDIGTSLAKVGGALTAGITVPLAAIGAMAIKTAGEFDQGMNRVQAVTDATAAEMQLLNDQALQLGKDTIFSARQAADGMAELGAAGFTTTQIYQAMPGVLALASAGQLKIADAALATANTLNQFGLAANQAGHVADVMAKAAAASAISVADMNESLKFVGPIAHSAGMSLEDTAAAIAVLGNAGIKADQAGTSLRGIIASLEAPSNKAQKALDALGITTKDLAGNLLPLDNIFGQLKASGATTADIFQIFTRNAASAAAVLTQQAGPAWDSFRQQMQNTEGAADKMAKTLQQGIQGQLEQLKGSVETAAIALGQLLKPAFDALVQAGTQLVNWLIDALKWFGELPAPIQAGAAALLAFGAAIGPIVLGIGGILTVLGTLAPALAGMAGAMGLTTAGMFAWAGAIAAVLAGLVALGVYIYQNWDQITVSFLGRVLAMEKAMRDFLSTLPGTKDMVANLTKTIEADSAEVAHSTKNIADNIAKKKELEAQQKKLNDQIAQAAKQSADATKGITALTGGTEKYTSAAGKAGKATDDLSKSHDKATKAAKGHADALGKVTEQSQIWAAIAQKLDGIHKQYIDKQADIALGLDKTTNATRQLVIPTDQLAASFTQLGNVLPATNTAMNAAGAAMKSVGIGATDATAPVYGLQDALHQFGIKSTADYNNLANEARRAYEAVQGDPNATDWEKDNLLLKMLQAQRDQMRANSEEIPADMQKTIDELNAEVSGSSGLKKTQGFFEDFGKSVSTVFTNFAQDISKTLWEGDGSWGEKGKKLLLSLGEAVTSSFLEPAAKAIAKFITGALADLLGGDGFGGLLDSIKKLGTAIADVFTGASKAAGDVADAAGGAAQAGAGAASGAGSAGAGAASGVTGIVGAVGSVVSAVSGVISNFQLAGVNKSLDVLVNHTLRIFNVLDQFYTTEWDRWGATYDRIGEVMNRVNTIMDNSNLAILKFDDVIGRLNSMNDLASRSVDALERIAGGASTNYGDSLLERMYASLEAIATNTNPASLSGRSVNVNLYGTDPSVVSAKLGTQLRLQGAFA